MKRDKDKAKEQLNNELTQMRERIKEAKASETERKRAEEALRESEHQFRQFFNREPNYCYMISPDGEVLDVNEAALKMLGYKKKQLVGKPLQTIYAPESLKKMKQLFEKWKETGELKDEELIIITRDGNRRTVLLSADSVKNSNGQLLHSVSVQKDITERKRIERDLTERVKELRCLYDISSVAERSYVTLDELYQEVANLLPDAWQYPDITCARVIINDKQWETENWRETKWKQSTNVKVSGVKAGAVEICYLEERPLVGEGPFLMEERHLIDAVAQQLGRITERKQLEEARVERAAALARTEEVQQSRQRIITIQESLRKDIAQEIHGSVQNRLIILMHRLADLERSSLSEQMAEEIADLRQKLGEVLEDHIRPISHRLFPSILRRGLVPALQSLVDQFEKAQSIDMELSEKLKKQEKINPRFIPEQVRLAVYRITEEALVNTIKHAKASKVTVKLEPSSEGWLRLVVRDDGRGFDKESVSANMGMPMMQDYAEVVGGSCVINSTPGKGTKVTVAVPFAEPGAEYAERAWILE